MSYTRIVFEEVSGKGKFEIIYPGPPWLKESRIVAGVEISDKIKELVDRLTGEQAFMYDRDSSSHKIEPCSAYVVREVQEGFDISSILPIV